MKLFTVYCLLFTVFTACSQDPALSAYEKAEDLFGKMAYTKAIKSYSSIVNKYPESPYAPASQYKIGLIHNLYSEDIQKAMNAYTTLILLYPKSPEVMLARQDMADIYIRMGNYRKAIGEYQWLINNTVGERRDSFQYQIAMIYLKLTDIKQARIEFEEILKKSPGSPLAPQVYYQIANTYYLEGDYKSAVNAYEKVVSLYPAGPYAQEAMLWKAICIEETGNLTEAMSLYRELEKSHPNPDVIKLRINGIEGRENKNIPATLKEK